MIQCNARVLAFPWAFSPRTSSVGKAGTHFCHVGTGFRGCNPIPHIPPCAPLLVVPAKAGTQGFQSLAPLFMPGAGSGSPLARGRRICLSPEFPDSLLRRCDRIFVERWSALAE